MSTSHGGKHVVTSIYVREQPTAPFHNKKQELGGLEIINTLRRSAATKRPLPYLNCIRGKIPESDELFFSSWTIKPLGVIVFRIIMEYCT